MDRNDLISRSELKKAFNKWWGCDDISTTVVEDLIDNAPTVHHSNCDNCEDKAKQYSLGFQDGYLTGKERPKGSWKLIKDKGNNVNAECPFCKFEIKCIAYNYSVWEVIQFIKNNDFDYKFPNYCENWGAELKGGAE